MTTKSKLLIVNLALALPLMFLQKNLVLFLGNGIKILAVAWAYSFLFSVLPSLYRSSNKLDYISPIFALIIVYFFFWHNTNFIHLFEIMIGAALGFILVIIELTILGKTVWKSNNNAP
jgi:hypothetical protein